MDATAGPALVERADHLARLAALLAEAAGGRGRMVLVRGEAGAGKTALVRTAVAGQHARWGWCEPLNVPTPLGPFRDLLDIGADGPVAVGERLLAAVRDEPSVLVVEDAHWIDDASADVVRYLGRRIGDSRGLVVVTYRDGTGSEDALTRVLGELPADESVVRLAVPPLSADGVAGMLSGSGRDPDEAWRATRGNAFLVDQLRRSADPTDAVRDSVSSRVARLGPVARSLVRTLAVTTGRVAADGLGTGPVGGLDESVRAGLLEEYDAMVGFRHELVRLAVEADLGPAERRLAHLAALERGGDPAVLAFHARGAGLTARAHELEVLAADRARRSAAHREAAAHLRRAAADDPPDDAARLWLALAVEEWTIGRDEAARAAVGVADRMTAGPATDLLTRAEVLRWRARLEPREERAADLAREAIALLAPRGPGPELARSTATLATLEMLARDLERAVAIGTVALGLAEETGDVEALVAAEQAVGCALVLGGTDVAAGAAHLRRAVQRADAAGLDREAARAHSNLVSAAGEVRRYDLVEEAVPAAVTYCRDRDLDAHLGYTRAWRARCLFEQGEWSQATEWVDQVLAAPAVSDITAVSALCTQGRIRARRGDPEVWRGLDAALTTAQATGSLQRLGPVVAGRAEARWLVGDPDDGSDGLLAALRLAGRRRAPWLVGELVLWATRHGLPVDPADVDRSASPYQLQVRGHAADAAEAWSRLGCPYEAADAWIGSGDATGVRLGLDLARRLGAGPLARIAARRLRELGVRSVPRGPRPATAAHPDGLTAREQEVLGWLRSGYTDAEIAQRLHLSTKTVGHHVSAVLRKTGTTSRRDLVERSRPGVTPT